MTNDELKKLLEWVEKKGKFTWNDLQQKFEYDEKKMFLVENALRSNRPDQGLVENLRVSGENPNLFVITTRGRLMLSELRTQKSPLVSTGLLILSIVSKALDHFDFISSDLFWIILGIVAVILLFLYWHTKNAVWGGLTIGLIIGVIISIAPLFRGGALDGYVIVKGAIIGILLGLVAELLGRASDYLKQK